MNAIGPSIAAARCPAVPKEEEVGGGGGVNSGGGGEKGGGELVGIKRPRGQGQEGGEEGGGKRRSIDANNTAKSNGDVKEAVANGRSPMDVEADGSGAGAGVGAVAVAVAGAGEELAEKNSSEAAVKPELEPGPVADSARESLETSKKAFSRVLRLWEGVAMEGKRGLHQRVVARLGRMLTEAEVGAEMEAAAAVGEAETPESEVRKA